MPRLARRLLGACFVIHHYSGGNRVFAVLQYAAFMAALWSWTTMLVVGPRVPGVVARRIGGRR